MTGKIAETLPQYPDDEISLAEIWQALSAHRRLIAVFTLACGVAAAAVSLWMTPIFRAEVVLSVVDGDRGGQLGGLASQFGGIAALAGVNLGTSSSKTDAVGTLSSKKLVETYIEKNNVLPVLFESRWDAAKGDWKTGTDKPTLWKATEAFTKSIRKINDDKKTGLVTLSVEWKDAALAAGWANELVALANEILRQRAIEKSKANLAYLDTQLEKATVVEVRQAIYRLIEAEFKNVMIAQGTSDYAFKVIDPAVTPEKKVKPKRMLITAVGLLLGFLISSFYAQMNGSRTTFR